MPTINMYMKDKEMVLQKEHTSSGANIGFMAILCNPNTLSFWTIVLQIINKTNRWDQEIVNDLIFIMLIVHLQKKINIKKWIM